MKQMPECDHWCGGCAAENLVPAETLASLENENERLRTALRVERKRAEKMRPVYEAARHYMSDPSPATKEALLRAWREDAALRGGEDR